LEIGGKPALEHVIEQLAGQGISRFVISVNYLGSMIKDYFKGGAEYGVEISYIDEMKPLGTAGSLSLLLKQSEPFFVINGDVMFQPDLRGFLKQYKDDTYAIIGTRTYSHKVPFGSLVVDKNQVIKISEKPEIKHLVSGGLYLLSPKICEHILPERYLDMPQLLTSLIFAGKKIQHHSIDGFWIDIGCVPDLELARNLMSMGKLYD
jgi:NDP-sugar pyrophosphorylase family protein